ncbi:MAG: tetratricopeptide repeat protein [Caldilineaceae bacterium]
MDLQQFGKQLQVLRKQVGLSQEGLVEALDQRARLGPAEEYRAVDGTLISRWEHARTQAGRQWKPTRTYMLHLIHIFATHLTVITAQQWAAQTGYQIAAGELADLFPPAAPVSLVASSSDSSMPESLPLHHNLPVTLTSFVGREAELALLTENLLTPATRLLTIVGEGGMGKTRLALAAGTRIYDLRFTIYEVTGQNSALVNQKSKIENQKFPDGVWFVALDGLEGGTNANLANSLATAIAKALAFSFPSATVDPATQLIHHLRSKALLLILDNFEHLMPGATFVVELLKQAEQIKVLATSRTPLNCQAEKLLWLHGLPILATNGAQAPGIQLFSERTRQQLPDFVLNERGVQEVAQLCQLINSNPLAIELAAHWMQYYSLSELIGLLQEQNLALLETDQQDVLPRHRAMTAVFETSWQLLSRSQQAALAQSSVFCGVFTREAFAAVTGAAFPVLVGLVNSSLLRQHRDAAGRVWYSLHELLRQFAARKLTAADFTIPDAQWLAQRRHSQYYLQMVARCGQQLYSVQAKDPLAELQSNIDNIRTAWRWAVANADSDLLTTAWPALRSYYHVRSHYQEGEEVFRLAADALRNHRPPLIDSDLPPAMAVAQAFFLNLLHRCDEAITLVQTVLTAWPKPGSPRPLWVQAHLEWGIGLSLREKHEAAIAKLSEVERWAQELALPVVAARALYAMQRNLFTKGEFTQARATLEQALHHYRQVGYRLAEGFVLRSLAEQARQVGRYPAALAYLQEALVIYQAAEDQPRTIALWKYLGDVYAALGQWGQALHYFQAALAQAKEAQEPTYTADVLDGCARLFGALGDYQQAEMYSQRADALNRQWGRSCGTAETLCTSGWVQNQVGRAAEAFAHYHTALALTQQSNSGLVEGVAWLGLGQALAQLRRQGEALAAYQQALAAQQAYGQQHLVIRTRSEMAASALQQGDLTTALQQVEEILASVDLATTQQIHEPLACALICYQVLQVKEDARAGLVLHIAWQRLQSQAATIDDEALRRSFLENVKVNQSIRELYAIKQPT